MIRILQKRSITVKKNMTEMKGVRAELVASFPATWISGPTGLFIIGDV
jgi:hypothetical protein